MPKARAREAEKLKRPQTQSSIAKAHPGTPPPPFSPFALLAINELLSNSGGITNISKSPDPDSEKLQNLIYKNKNKHWVGGRVLWQTTINYRCSMAR